MTQSTRQLIVGRDRAVTRQILGVTAVLTATAFGTLAVPAFWAEYVSASGAETIRLATATAFLLSVVAAVYLVSKAGNVNPYVPTAAVFVVLTSYGLTEVVTGFQLVFVLGPSIFLGVLAALSAYANDGAVASLSLVFFPVFGYMINAPYGIGTELGTVDRIRVALLFSLLFTFSIGIAGFLIGITIRRAVEYADLFTIEELIHTDPGEIDTVVETVDAEVVDAEPADNSAADANPTDAEPADTKPASPELTDSEPNEAESTDSGSTDSEPNEAESADPEPTDSESAGSGSTGSEPPDNSGSPTDD